MTATRRPALLSGAAILSSGLCAGLASAEIGTPEMVEAARAGDTTIDYYFILGAEANRPLYDAFAEHFDFIDFAVTGGDPLSLVEKILNEDASGQPVADILQGGPMEDGIVNLQSGLGATIQPAAAANVPDEFKFSGEYIVPDYFTFHIAYNVNMLSPEEAPLTLEDLTQPEWNGRFGIDLEQIDWFAGKLAYYGEERGMEIFEALAANDPVLFAGAAGYEQLAAGALPVVVNTFSALAVDYIERGAPIDFAVSPFVIAQPDLYIGLEQSSNAAAVELFFEFLFTPEAQEILAQQVYKNPVLPGIAPPPHLDEALAPEIEKFFVTSENWGDFEGRIALFQSLFVQ